MTIIHIIQIVLGTISNLEGVQRVLENVFWLYAMLIFRHVMEIQTKNMSK